MNRLSLEITLTCLCLAALACTKPNPDRLFADANTGTDDGDGESSDGDSGDGASEDGGTSEEGAPSDLPVCEAIMLDVAEDCSVCLEQECCSELIACADEDGCACLGACLMAGGDPLACALDECGLAGLTELPSVASALQECSDAACVSSCGATP